MRPNTSQNMNALSAAADQSGSVIPADYIYAISVQAIVTGTSTGTLNIQASNDIAPPVDANGNGLPTNWSDIPTVGTVAIAGAGTYLMPQFNIAYKWIRSSFTHTNAAAGTITVNVHTMGF